jgi:hypothetical protein
VVYPTRHPKLVQIAPVAGAICTNFENAGRWPRRRPPEPAIGCGVARTVRASPGRLGGASMNHGRSRVGTASLLPVLAMVAFLAGCTRTSEPPSPSNPGNGPSVATNPDGGASFPLPTDAGDAIKRAGLSLRDEKEALPDQQYRSHLDVFVNGKKVVVPANIGVDVEAKQHSPLHTLDDSGIVHGETDKDRVLRVGQFFQEWGITLDKNCLATFCADDHNQLLGFANGQLVPDPASIPFENRQEIVIWYGPKGTNPEIPVSFTFPT